MSTPKKRESGRRTQKVRIIGGMWRRTMLPVPDVDGLRPTPDRVRETVFNWLDHLIGGAWPKMHCLDLFAGSGAMSFEAASRGAGHVTLIETHPAALRQLDAVKQKLAAHQVSIIRGDAFQVAQRFAAEGVRFDLIFLDPPYQHDWLLRALAACAPLLSEKGYVYAESPNLPAKEGKLDDLSGEFGWRLVRAERAGTVRYALLQKTGPDVFEA